MNNSDRIPVIWNNDGNANNLLCKVDVNGVTNALIEDFEDTSLRITDIVAIDSRCFCIRETDHIAKRNLENYLERLNRYLSTLFRDLSEALEGRTVGALSLPSMETVRNFMMNWTGIDLSNAQLF